MCCWHNLLSKPPGIILNATNATTPVVTCFVGDKFDHNITDSIVNMIWAHGQVKGHFNPTIPPPPPGVSSASFISDFYRMRELKYHGSGGRGSARINLVSPPTRPTTQCVIQVSDGRNGINYQASWERSRTDSTKVVFELQGTGGTNSWIGIGFSGI